MRAAPRKIDDEKELYNASLRALMRRAYSTYEMRTYLERRASEESLAGRVVARLKHEKLIDDARYALEFSRGRATLRKQGRYRIARELRARGVPDRHIEAAVAQAFAETDEALLVRKVIERRLRRAQGPLDQKKLASLYRTLMRAGFDGALIRREVQAAARGSYGEDVGLPSEDLAEPEAAE